MGVPVIDAPSEAEAQCASMAAAGLVYGAATEDMDCLTFGCPTLIRHLMAPSSQNAPIQEFSLSVLLEARAARAARPRKGVMSHGANNGLEGRVGRGA
jgi:5'-3' exonuclease